MKSENHNYYRTVLYAFVMSQLVIMVWGAYAFSHSQSLLERIGYVLSVGINGGFGFCAAHELIHKKERWDNWMGNLILLITATGHASMEHVLVHHDPFIAGTDIDHVHAHSGMSFYKFYLKAMVGLRTSAYAAEKKLMIRKGHHQLSLYNRLVFLNLCSLLVALVLGVIFGYQAILYFIAVAIVSSL